MKRTISPILTWKSNHEVLLFVVSSSELIFVGFQFTKDRLWTIEKYQKYRCQCKQTIGQFLMHSSKKWWKFHDTR